MNTHRTRLRPQRHSQAAESHVDEINRPADGEHTHLAAAYQAVEAAQLSLDGTHGMPAGPDQWRAAAEAHRQRAQAWTRLAQVLPLSTPVALVRAVLLAALHDADQAGEHAARLVGGAR